MTSNILSIPLSNLKNILFFITILSLISLLQALSLKYPSAFTLEDGNLLVIHSLGIDTCDPLYTTNTPQLEFTSELIQSDLSKISISKYDSGEYMILINDIIYLFDEKGEFILSSFLPDGLNAEYFSLSVDGVTQDDSIKYYFFLLGYIDKSNLKLNLYYNYLDSQTKTITSFSSALNYANDISNTGLSCEFLIEDENYYILCIYDRLYYEYDSYFGYYIDYEDINFSIFEINQDKIELKKEKNFDSLYLKYIRSTTKFIGSRPFFCGINKDKEPLCLSLIYSDFNYVGEDGKNVFYYEPYSKTCINAPYNIRTYNITETV